MSNEQIYEYLMRRRKEDPKGYFLNSVSLKYDMIVSAFKKKNIELVRERVEYLNEYLKEYAPVYGITAPELKQYFSVNNMSLNFKF